MPVEFLSPEQQRRYGRYTEDPSPLPLARYFHCDDREHQLMNRHRTAHTRLGFAVPLGTVRFLGTCLPNPTDVPANVTTYVAHQLGGQETTCLPQYHTRDTHWDHATEMQREYGYQDFHDPREIFPLGRWLYTRAWLSAARPRILFDWATARLVERQGLRPGVTVLARLVARVRDRAAIRLWHRLVLLPNTGQQAKRAALLEGPDGATPSPLDRLRRAPPRISGPALVTAWQRLAAIRAIGIGQLSLAHMPPNRLRAFARYGAAARAQAIAQMTPERRMATLLAFASVFEETAMDDALDLLDVLRTDISRAAHKDGEHERLRTLRALATAAWQLWNARQMLLDERVDAAAVRPQTLARIPHAQMLEAGAQGETWARPPDAPSYPELVERYRRVRRFVPTLLRPGAFESPQAGHPMRGALDILRRIAYPRLSDLQQAPLDIVARAWRRLVLPRHTPGVARQAYPLCAMERLPASLRRRDVLVAQSERWGTPRVQLLQGPQWAAVRSQICRALGRSEAPEPALHALSQHLDAAYQRTAANVPTNAAVRIEQGEGRATLTVTGLDNLEEPVSLIKLREQVLARLPRVDLPAGLLDIHARTGCAHEFTPISEGAARGVALPMSLCAVVLAAACHIGLEPVAHAAPPALTRGRLSWIQQN